MPRCPASVSTTARRHAGWLLDLGHRQIGVIAGRSCHNDRAGARVVGIHKALAGRGLALPKELLIKRPYQTIEGQHAFRALMATAQPPTAIICGIDRLSFGALIECGRQRIEVAKGLSIVGFDDLELTGQIVASLTTLHVPAAEIGRHAAEYLFAHQRLPRCRTEPRCPSTSSFEKVRCRRRVRRTRPKTAPSRCKGRWPRP